jgi:hypothetical protein
MHPACGDVDNRVSIGIKITARCTGEEQGVPMAEFAADMRVFDV